MSSNSSRTSNKVSDFLHKIFSWFSYVYIIFLWMSLSAVKKKSEKNKEAERKINFLLKRLEEKRLVCAA